MRKLRVLGALALTTALLWACGEDDPGFPSDTIPPARITDLAIWQVSDTSITLTWTAPGDDGDAGSAESYVLKRSDASITASNFEAATTVPGLPAPKIAGSTETFEVTAIDTNLTYHFALRTDDDHGNPSPISNQATWVHTGVPVHVVKSIPPARDNTIYEDGDSSNGTGDFIFAGETANTLARRALLYFAIADSLPAGAVIDSVEFTLHLSRTIVPLRTMTIHTLTADWGEGTSNADGLEGTGIHAQPGDATWTHRFYNTTNWTTPGGDFVALAVSSRGVSGVGFYTWKSAALATDVQSWLDTPATNFGWILIGDETASVSAKRFDSREHPVPTNRPKLTIYYTFVR